jgi:hypothetical protein
MWQPILLYAERFPAKWEIIMAEGKTVPINYSSPVGANLSCLNPSPTLWCISCSARRGVVRSSATGMEVGPCCCAAPISGRRSNAALLSGVLKHHDSPLIEINSVRDHIHILFAQSKNHAPAKIVEQVKSASSGWIKTLDAWYADFAWQGGYGEFSRKDAGKIHFNHGWTPMNTDHNFFGGTGK